MTANPCLVFYGNSVFLAGIRAELERDPELGLALLSVEAGPRDVTNLLRAHKPCAILFDLTMDLPGLVVSILRQQPGLLMIGVDPSCNEMLVLTSRQVQALAVRDLVRLIFEATHENIAGLGHTHCNSSQFE